MIVCIYERVYITTLHESNYEIIPCASMRVGRITD